MVDYAFPPRSASVLPVEGTAAVVPVRRIFCIGRNYGGHVREMGGDPSAQPPIFFSKPADAVVVGGADVAYPSQTRLFHHEIELVAVLGGGGSDVEPDAALDLVFGYAAGVDLTRRDLQNAAKDAGAPWDSSKGFDASAPIGLVRPAARCGPMTGRIALSVNGAPRQDGRLSDMIWPMAAIIAQCSRLWRLEAGDVIFTGTPDGVGPLQRGDRVHGEIDGVGEIEFSVV